jgi:hypothetical protein
MPLALMCITHLHYAALTLHTLVCRCSANVVDTLLFHNGMPYRWLFTSEKTGVRNATI